jgi:hypothetical protein
LEDAVAGRSAPFELRRVTALIGPYGSGKTELALGLALHAAQRARDGSGFARTVVADLDVLKPYFRSREAGGQLAAEGIELLAPQAALALADLPIVTPELRGSVARKDSQVLLDVGGDPVGARALGSLSDAVAGEEYDLLLVLNRHRPFMDGLDAVLGQAQQMAGAAQLSITGVVSNTHMLEETTPEDVEWGLSLAREVASALGVPVRLLAVPMHLAERFRDRDELPPVVAIRRRMMPAFLGGVVLARRAALPAFVS